MVKSLTIRLAPWQIPRPKKLCLLTMPIEIRMAIYEAALVEPPRWDKLHKPRCPYRRDARGDTFELPPFFLMDMYLEGSHLPIDEPQPVPWTMLTDTSCRCGKRESVALLQTCKQVYEEASHLFWNKNKFCFLNGWDLLYGVDYVLRPSSIQMIRSLSIVAFDPNDNFSHMGYVLAALRSPRAPITLGKALHKFTNLEFLDIDSDVLLLIRNDLRELQKCNTRLREIEVNRIDHIGHLGDEPVYQWINWVQTTPKMLLYRCSRRIKSSDGCWTADYIKDFWRDFRLNFGVHVRTAVETQLLGIDIDSINEPIVEIDTDYNDLTGPTTQRDVSLPTGEDVTVTIYGLPRSVDEKIKVAREKMRKHRLGKLPNGSTVPQQEVAKLEAARKKENREREMEQELQAYQEILAGRSTRLEELEAEQRTSEKKARKKVLRKAKKHEEIKAQQRKRASRQGQM